MRRAPAALIAALLMGWLGCADGPPRRWIPQASEGYSPLGPLPARSGGMELPDGTSSRGKTHQTRYLEFEAEQGKALAESDLPENERRLRWEALAELGVWRHDQSERALAATPPEEMYARILLRLERRNREEAAHWKEVDAHLDEFMRWGHQLLAEVANPFHDVGPGYLATDNPLRYGSRQALVQATWSWAFSHTRDPDFLHKSPSEVALYLLARDSALRQLIMLGHFAHGHLDYTPELDHTRYTLGEVATETLVGFIPIIGSIADAGQAATGISLTGHSLEDEDRVLLALGAMVPIVHALKGAHGLETVAHLAQVTGRSAEEIEALFRVAGHLGDENAAELERIVQKAVRREHLAQRDLDSLERIAGTLRRPLEEVADTVRAHGGGIGLKTDLMTGSQLAPGTPEHMYQRWVDYQFRNPGRRGGFSLAMDPEWQRMYRQILENAEAGGEFQSEALAFFKHEKNTAMMMPPPGSTEVGFIPDAVEGRPAELIWGQPYQFVEVKGRKDLSFGGNLKAMIEYVKNVEGAELKLVVRSAKHPDGATRMTEKLQGELKKLEDMGRFILEKYPK